MSERLVDATAAHFKLGKDAITWFDNGMQSVPEGAVVGVVRQQTPPNISTLLYVEDGLVHEHEWDRTGHFLKTVKVNDAPEALLQCFSLAENCQWLPSANGPLERHVVVSVGSGIGTAAATWSELVRPTLSQLGLSQEQRHYYVHLTVSDSTISDLTRNLIFRGANRGIHQAILLLSGDGGVLDIVNSLVSAPRSPTYIKPTISLLPLGTGNALANSSGLCGDKTLGLRSVLRGTPKPLPLFKATFSPGARVLVEEGSKEVALQSEKEGNPIAHGAVVCSWGHHAALVADSDTTAYRKYGNERFKMAAKEALFPSDGSAPHAYTGKVSIRRPGKDWEALAEHKHGYVLTTFVSQLEAGFVISPDSKPLDGKFRLVRFGDLDGKEAMGIMEGAFKGGKHVESEKVQYEEIEGLRIEFHEDDGRWRRVCIDGKIVRVEKGGWVEVNVVDEGVVDLVCHQE